MMKQQTNVFLNDDIVV